MYYGCSYSCLWLDLHRTIPGLGKTCGLVFLRIECSVYLLASNCDFFTLKCKICAFGLNFACSNGKQNNAFIWLKLFLHQEIENGLLRNWNRRNRCQMYRITNSCCRSWI